MNKTLKSGRGALVSLLVLLSVLVTVRAASATVVVALELGEMARDAATIVRGRVVAVDSRWTDDRRGVETLVTLAVESALKGADAPDGSVTFRVPGGRLGRIRNIVVGAPQFAVDEEVVVFLAHRGPSIPHVVGFNQGVYRIAARDGSLMVQPPVLDGTTMAGPVMRGDGTRRPIALQAFEQQVRTLAREGR